MGLIRLISLADKGDGRGRSFTPPSDALDSVCPIKDVHIATIHPDSIRGNHYHKNHHEIVLVVYSDTWTIYWDDGPGTEVHNRMFSGTGAIMVDIPQRVSHAVLNNGERDLVVIGISGFEYTAENSDTIYSKLI